jgi:hypothetical protein
MESLQMPPGTTLPDHWPLPADRALADIILSLYIGKQVLFVLFCVNRQVFWFPNKQGFAILFLPEIKLSALLTYPSKRIYRTQYSLRSSLVVNPFRNHSKTTQPMMKLSAGFIAGAVGRKNGGIFQKIKCRAKTSGPAETSEAV